MATRKRARGPGRSGYPPEVKAKALSMFKKGEKLAAVHEATGVSKAGLQIWKRDAGLTSARKQAGRRRGAKKAVAPADTMAALLVAAGVVVANDETFTIHGNRLRDHGLTTPQILQNLQSLLAEYFEAMAT